VEGLLVHALVRDLAGRLPLRSLGNLVLRYHPPSPILTLDKGRLVGPARTPFQ
jgi:hypothetical protein